MPPPAVAVVFTRASPCRCAEAWLEAIGALGLRGLPVAAEEMSAHRVALAEAALVIEYTDTYRGRGDLRPLVRHQLASWGARIVGAPADAAQAADDKIAARVRLGCAGLAVAAGRLLTHGDAGGDGIAFPAIVKRPFEHGSRGVKLVRSRAELEAVAGDWWKQGEGTLLVEEFVDGREVALSVIEEEDGPRCLPPVEIALPAGTIYSRRRKWGHKGPALGPAAFSGPEADLLRATAISAFRALELADVARFDVRLAARGPVLLEANVRPSVEPGLALPLAASLAGLDFVATARLVLRSAARRHGQGDVIRRLGTP